MKRFGFSFFTAFLTIVLALSLTSCDQNGICITATGEAVDQTLDLATINGFQVNGEASVFVEQGTEQKVIVRAPQAMLDALDFSVTNGILLTELDRCFTRGQLEVYVTVTEPLTEISVSGAGDWINTTDVDFVDEVSLSVSGSGNLTVNNIEATQIDAKVSGSGDLVITGSTKSFIAKVSGSGDIDAYELRATSIEAGVSGSGTAKVNAEGADLEATVSGSGDVYYRGNPTSFSANVSGSGDVQQR